MHIMRYYLTIKKEILSFVTTWRDLGVCYLKLDTHRKTTSYDCTHTWNLNMLVSWKLRAELLLGLEEQGEGKVSQQVQCSIVIIVISGVLCHTG